MVHSCESSRPIWFSSSGSGPTTCWPAPQRVGPFSREVAGNILTRPVRECYFVDGSPRNQAMDGAALAGAADGVGVARSSSHQNTTVAMAASRHTTTVKEPEPGGASQLASLSTVAAM